MATALVMLSGGIDSATALYETVKNFKTSAIFFDYGQRCADFELTSARQISRSAGVPLEVVDISGIKRLFLGISKEPVVAIGFLSASRANCPHGLFGIASTYCISAGIDVLVTGIQREDTDGLNDVKGYLHTWANAIRHLQSINFDFHSPLIDMAKADVLRMGHNINVPFALSDCLTTRSDRDL